MNERTTTEGIAEQVVALLAESDFRHISRDKYPSWPTTSLAYEDEYALLAFWRYEMFEELESSWLSAQDQVIRLLGSNLVSGDPKSWDGYLILATADSVPAGHVGSLSAIRSDTRRLRKLVITGDDLPDLKTSTIEIGLSVRRVLAPILDISFTEGLNQSDPLDSVTERLSLSGPETETFSMLLDAHRRGRPPVETLYESRKLPGFGQSGHT